MRFPIIGLTTSRTSSKHGYMLHSAAEAYVKAVAGAGGCPVLVPVGLGEAAYQALLPRLDGVLFTGGGDIHPGYYGAEADPQATLVDSERDQMELGFLEYAVQNGLPFLGICRGLQLVNVGLGGNLYGDILSQRPGSQRHDFFPELPRDHLAHPVQIEPDSRLASILGRTSLKVNSLHHQAVRDPAPGVRVTARAGDGVVEGLELDGHPFGLAVQWHPEWLQHDDAMRALFQAFTGAARGERIP